MTIQMAQKNRRFAYCPANIGCPITVLYWHTIHCSRSAPESRTLFMQSNGCLLDDLRPADNNSSHMRHGNAAQKSARKRNAENQNKPNQKKWRARKLAILMLKIHNPLAGIYLPSNRRSCSDKRLNGTVMVWPSRFFKITASSVSFSTTASTL